MKLLTIMIGRSGSGKSWLADAIQERATWGSVTSGDLCSVYDIDNYLINEHGEYEWTPERMFRAVNMYWQAIELGMSMEVAHIICANCNLKVKESKMLAAKAKQYGYTVQRIILLDKPFEDQHNVPIASRNKQYSRLQTLVRHINV